MRTFASSREVLSRIRVMRSRRCGAGFATGLASVSHPPDGPGIEHVLSSGWHLTLLAAGALVLAACRGGAPNGERGRARIDTTAGALPGEIGLGGARPDSIPAHAVTWNLAMVGAALRRVGLSPAITPEEIRQPFLSVRGALLKIPGADVQVFIYADASAAARDVARLDTARVAPPTMMVEWISRPHLVVDNNLVAIVLTDDDALQSRVRRALSASEISHDRQ
jgi:hypothetical protein